MHFVRSNARLVLVHWLALAVLVGSLLTGLRIYAANRLLIAPNWLPQGDVYFWHLAFAAVWPALFVVYWLHRRATPVPERHGANRWLIRMLRYALVFQLASGLWLYLLPPLPAVLALHRYSAFASVLLVVLHGVFQWLYTAWPAVRAIVLPRPRRAMLQARVLIPLLAIPLPALLPFQRWLAQELPAAQIGLEDSVSVDGDGSDPVWGKATPVTINTLTVGSTRITPVEVRALRQGAVMYLRFRWPDTTASLAHLPLVKTAEGWRVEQNGLMQNDEQDHYEDKLAVMLGRHGGVAGDGSVRLGPQPQAGWPRAQRGYHATAAGQLVDVWHWKAVREAGTMQMDDNHFGPPYPVVEGLRRYTAGYRADPHSAGGFSENWQWLGDGVVLPKRLPQSGVAPAPVAGQPYGMSWFTSRPYDASLDHYPVGTRLPSVLWTTEFEGDRADVRAAGQWHDGYWTLETARGIDTGSKFDVPLTDGTWLWVAVFDHSQTRHTYHLRPLRLRWSTS
ncbi:ethylbenzene dehydrogenase-related protein [Chitinibacteraceae bacterium HSL-7]